MEGPKGDQSSEKLYGCLSLKQSHRRFEGTLIKLINSYVDDTTLYSFQNVQFTFIWKHYLAKFMMDYLLEEVRKCL